MAARRSIPKCAALSEARPLCFDAGLTKVPDYLIPKSTVCMPSRTSSFYSIQNQRLSFNPESAAVFPITWRIDIRHDYLVMHISIEKHKVSVCEFNVGKRASSKAI